MVFGVGKLNYSMHRDHRRNETAIINTKLPNAYNLAAAE